MTSDKNPAAIIGIFFILATAMGITNAATLGPFLVGPDYQIVMSENSGTVVV